MIHAHETDEYRYDGWRWTCKRCGDEFHIPSFLRDMPTMDCACRVEASEPRRVGPPSLAVQLENFLSAVGEHLTDGAQMCSDEEIARRVKICEGCDRFDMVRRRCNECGCPVHAGRKLVSKLAWVEQKCPHPDGDKWA